MAKGSDDMIKNLTLTILCSVTEELNKFPEVLSNEPQEILKDLIDMFEHAISEKCTQAERECNEKVIIIMMNIIMSTNNMAVVNELLKHFMEVYNSQARRYIADKQIILEEILSLVHTSLLALSKTALPKPELKDMVFSVIDNHIHHYGTEA